MAPYTCRHKQCGLKKDCRHDCCIRTRQAHKAAAAAPRSATATAKVAKAKATKANTVRATSAKASALGTAAKGQKPIVPAKGLKIKVGPPPEDDADAEKLDDQDQNTGQND